MCGDASDGVDGRAIFDDRDDTKNSRAAQSTLLASLLNQKSSQQKDAQKNQKPSHYKEDQHQKRNHHQA